MRPVLLSTYWRERITLVDLIPLLQDGSALERRSRGYRRVCSKLAHGDRRGRSLAWLMYPLERWGSRQR